MMELPEPRVVLLNINGSRRHHYTWSETPIDDLCLGDLKPFVKMDAYADLERIVKDYNSPPTPEEK